MSEMTKDQMLARADHVFIGVIEKQQYELWPFLRIPVRIRAGECGGAAYG
jgi:hypothetical protein